MLDQNTTTVITAIITVMGTLGGAVVGVLLSNQHTSKQEKSKRNTPMIEEAYTLINQLDDIIDKCLQENSLLVEGMREANDRLRTLVHLYLRSAKKEYGDYSKAHWKLMNMLRDKEGRYHRDDKNKDEVMVEESEIYWDYRKHFATMMHSLEKLVD